MELWLGLGKHMQPLPCRSGPSSGGVKSLPEESPVKIMSKMAPLPTAIADHSQGDCEILDMCVCTSCRVCGWPSVTREARYLRINLSGTTVCSTYLKMSPVGRKWGIMGWEEGETGGYIPEETLNHYLYVCILYTYIYLLDVPSVSIKAKCRVTALTNVCMFCKLELHCFWNDWYRKSPLVFGI